MCSIIGVGERLHKDLGQIDRGTLDSGDRSLPFGLLVWLKFLEVYACRTSFGQKYDHFSLLCKQMDIYLRKLYIVRKVTSAPTFLA